MKPLSILLLALGLFLFSCTEDQNTSDKEITVEVDTLSKPLYLSTDIMCGTVQFTDGCGESTDSLIRFGLALLHHMTYEDASKVFQRVIDQDKDCFWGHWGKAMTYIHPLWPDAPTTEKMKDGIILSQRAMKLAQKENEKWYGAALTAYYDNGLMTNEKERLQAFHNAWKQAHEQLPEDLEAQLFYALSCLATVPASDKSYETQLKAGALAEQALETIPDHPGGFHYAIHAYDFPPLANKAIRVASNYSKIAPEIPHALHMPTHIFTRLGYWKESVELNKRSAESAWKHPAGDNISLHYLHAIDYMVHAHLQMAEEEFAQGYYDLIEQTPGPFQVHAGSAYAMAAIPARLVIEKKMWKDAAEIDVLHRDDFPWEKFPQFEALVHFAKGIGAGRTNNAAVAQAAVEKLTELQTTLGNKPATSYWYNQIAIQKRAVEAWLQYAKGERDAALAIMEEAADMESKSEKSPITPGEVIQVREMLGDLLLEMEQPDKALQAYQAALENSPNRFYTLYGAGKAAEMANENELAKAYFAKLLELNGTAATQRAALTYAKQRTGLAEL